MPRIRDATLDEVLVLDPRLPEGTQNTIRGGAPYGLWRFDRSELARIGGQLPGEMGPPHGATIGTLGELIDRWLAWIRSSNDQAVKDRESHDYWLGELRAGHRMLPPVLYHARGHSTRHIADGRHRLFAALEYATDVPTFELELFWSDVATEYEGV